MVAILTVAHKPVVDHRTNPYSTCHSMTLAILTFDIGLTLDGRVRLLPAATDSRRGTIRYIGPVPEIPGGIGPWIGVALDEPTGKNDGTIKDKRYFTCTKNCGVFVRPERCEAGDWEVLGLEGDEDLEEL
jgi:tubulin-specific chaperone B